MSKHPRERQGHRFWTAPQIIHCARFHFLTCIHVCASPTDGLMRGRRWAVHHTFAAAFRTKIPTTTERELAVLTAGALCWVSSRLAPTSSRLDIGGARFQTYFSGARQLRSGSAPPWRPGLRHRAKPQLRSLRQREPKGLEFRGTASTSLSGYRFPPALHPCSDKPDDHQCGRCIGARRPFHPPPTPCYGMKERYRCSRNHRHREPTLSESNFQAKGSGPRPQAGAAEGCAPGERKRNT